MDILLEERKRLGDWYLEFIEESSKRDNRVAISRIDNLIRETMGFETVEKIEMIEEEIEKARSSKKTGLTEEDVAKFYRITRMLRKRIEKPKYSEIGELIKNLRLSKGLSLRQMQEVSGISSSYIHRIEKGDRKTPSKEMLEKIAMALDQDPVAFVTLAEGNSSIKQTGSTGNSAINVETLLFNTPLAIKGRDIDEEEKSLFIKTVIHLLNCDFGEKNMRK